MNIRETPSTSCLWDSSTGEPYARSFYDNQYKVYTEKGDPEIISLYEKYKTGKLILQPDFQRMYVWDKVKASRLIESVLLRIPLPIIYLSEAGDGREEVIDGQQRLTSFFSYLDGIFPPDQQFDLQKLTVFSHLNGMLFSDLTRELQDIIRYYHLRTITILKESSNEIKFEIFERINTGSTPLNEMEIRNCMYRGPYLNLLKQLSQNEEFLHCIQAADMDYQLKDVEMVIRFASFFHAGYENYHAPMRRFINQDLESYRNISSEDEKILSDAFLRAVKNAHHIFLEHTFARYYGGTKRDPQGRWGSRIHILLYDSWMHLFAAISEEDIALHRDAIREALIDLMASNYSFTDAITFSTSSKERVIRRFMLAQQAVDEILKTETREETTHFSLQNKIEHLGTNPICVFCNQKIHDSDDAAIAGIDRYWIPDAILPQDISFAHRYCNRHNV